MNLLQQIEAECRREKLGITGPLASTVQFDNGIEKAMRVIRNHFSALKVEDIAGTLRPHFGASARLNGEHKDAAQSIIKLLRG